MKKTIINISRTFLTLISALLISGYAYSLDHFTESFSGGPSDYFTGNHTFSSGLTWELANIKGESAANSVGGIGGASRFLISTTSFIVSPSVNTVGTISFQYRELNAVGGGTFKVQKSVGGGAFTDIATQNFSGTGYQTFSISINDASNDIRIKVVGIGNTTYLIIDELTLTALSSDPTLVVSPSILSGFNYVVGSGPSGSQSYSLSGTNLTGYPSDITVTAPANYEVSLSSGSGFASSILVPYGSATLGSTTIYVRLIAGLSIGSYNSAIITNLGGGVISSTDVTCNGSVADIPPAMLNLSSSTLNGFTYIIGSGPSTWQSYNLSGTYLTGYPGNIAVTAPTNYEVSLSSGSGYSTSISVPYTTATLTSTPIYVRLKTGLSVGMYNSEIISNAGGGATTLNVTCNGNVTAVPPAILSVSPSSLSGFNYTVGSGPSAQQSYNLSGTNLTGYPNVITITAPSDYEISLSSGSGYTTSLNVPYNSASLASTLIYVRLISGLSIGSYNSQVISNAGGGATTVNLSCSGEVLDVAPDFTCEDFNTATAGTYSTSFTINGQIWTCSAAGNFSYANTNMGSPAFTINDDNSNAHITSPSLNTCGTVSFKYAYINGTDANVFQLQKSTDGSTFTTLDTHTLGSEANLTYQDYSFNVNEVSSTTYIRILSDNQNAHLFIEDFCTSPYSNTSPELELSLSNLFGFNYVEGSGPSTQQSFELSGTDLNGTNVIITPSANYEISLSSGTGFQSSPISIPSFGGAATTVYVRLKAGLLFGTYNLELITVSGGGASDITVTCNGTVDELATPILSTTLTSLSGFNYIEGSGPSAEQSFELSGTNLNGSNVSISALTNYEISLNSGTGFQSTPITITAYSGSATTVYVRLKSGLLFGTYDLELITVSGGGASDITVTCNGTVSELLTPSLSATPTSLSSFTYIEGSGPSSQQSFTLSGIDLDGSDVTVYPSINYEISLSSGTGFQLTPIVLSAYDGSSQTIYVRLKAGLAFGIWNLELITISGGGASEINVTCNGSVEELLAPELLVNSENLNDFSYIFGFGPSDEQNFVLSGNNLNNEELTISAPANYEISLTSGTGFQSNPIIFNSFSGDETSIFVRLKANLTVGDYIDESITIVGSGAAQIVVICNGYVDENVGISKELTNNDIQIYPNPTSDIINISISNWDSDELSFEISDMLGQNVLSGKLECVDGLAFKQTDIGMLKPGIYTLRVFNYKQSIYRKINKQ